MASLPNLTSADIGEHPQNPIPHPLPSSKLAAVHRFKAHLTREPKTEIVFPPPSWGIDDDASTEELSLTPSDQEDVTALGGTSYAELEPEPDETETPPEPTTFAMKIKQLIESLPIPASVMTIVGLGSHVEPPTIPSDGQGPPIPDVVDARTAKLLASENVMKGEGTSRQSVWSVLEGMKQGHTHPAVADTAQDLPDDGGSIMLYSPLEPTEESELELAELGLEYVDEKLPPPSLPSTETIKGKGKETEPTPTITTPAPRIKKRWVPSTTKISVLVTWWGYRIYLPPPVMAALGSSEVKATKRAAMFAAALQWLLIKIPITMMPPQIQGAAKLLRLLTPLVVGYIGVFVAWSWTRIRACDKGNGVVLTATWLLTAALIPSAWDAGDIQGPKPRPPTPPPIEKNDDNGNGKGKNKKGKGK